MDRTPPSTPTGRAPRVARGLAVALAISVFGVSAGTASARTHRLVPDKDVVSRWQKVGARTAWRALDDPAGKLEARSYIRTGSRPGITRVAFENLTLNRRENVRSGRLRFYGKTGPDTTLRVRVLWKGKVHASAVVKRRAPGKWRSLPVKAKTVAQVNSMQVQFQAVGGTDAQVAATYAQVATASNVHADSDVTVFDSATSVRAYRPLPAGGSDRADLVTAKNEFESFQVSVEGGQAGVPGLTVALTAPLTGPGGYSIPGDDVTIYREAQYVVDSGAGKPPSNASGSAGQWPDGLIPERDYFYGEDRNAFPVDVAPGGRVTAWIDVLAPADAPAGLYSGTITVTAANGLTRAVPVHLKVLNLTLPSTSSLKSSFLVSPTGWQPCRAMMGRDCGPTDDASWQLDYLYQRAALENRITLSNAFPGGYDQAPPRDKFARYGAPLISGDGQAPVPGVGAPRLPGARMTTVSAYWQCITAAPCLANWHSLATEFGFSDRFWAYTCDEPQPQDRGSAWDDWGDCKRNSLLAQAQWPGINRVVTSSMRLGSEAEGRGQINLSTDTDTLAVQIGQMANKPGQWLAGNQRPTYDTYLGSNAPGTAQNQLWMYNSCESYSCDENSSSQYTGWAGYAIDAAPSEARAMGWLSFLYGSSGELYYNTMQHIATAWSNQYESGANGDGTLFYPGLTQGGNGSPAIGGSHGIPIESLRLKRIRDGREDYELMRLLASRGRGSQAASIVSGLFGSPDSATFSTDVTPSAVHGSRCALFDALLGAGSCTIS